jgi:hypothetical protein
MLSALSMNNKNQKRKLILIIKILIILAYFLFSLRYVTHSYLAVLVSPPIVSPPIVSPPIVSPPIESSYLSNVSVTCRAILNITVLYPNFTGCFSNNYAWVAILDELNLLNNLAVQYLVPLFLYFFIFIIAKNINMNINKFMDMIILSIFPNIISRLINRGLSGIESENENMFFNAIKVLYLNFLNYTPERSAFGSEMRQIASFLIVILVYTTALKVYTFKVLYLFILLTFIHIYSAFLILPILMALIFTKIPHRNKIAFFCVSHTLVCLYLQSSLMYTHNRYFLYHILLGVSINLIETFSRSKVNSSINKSYFLRFNLNIIVFYFIAQLIILYIRHIHFYTAPENKVLGSIILYEKGSGIIERISIFLRPLVYLYIINLLSFKFGRYLPMIQYGVKQNYIFLSNFSKSFLPYKNNS